ncbi:MAG: hypothetical protein HFJ42_04905 [Clostridia bacterium]|nr:hypothetical protein [Clostridia bacterium]
MYFKVEQISKSLYGAEFNIVDTNGNKLGNVIVNGRMGTMEVNVQINFIKDTIVLKYGYKNIKEAIKASFGKAIFRPYDVIVNNREDGRIGTQYIKQGMTSKIAVKELTLNELKFESYFCGLGKEGQAYSIYTNETQIAQINKNNEVINALHKYEIKCIEDKYVIPTLIECIYIYVFSDYTPGEKIIKGKKVTIVNTTDKFLKSKYNANFWKEN